jgi:hypothetical protein
VTWSVSDVDKKGKKKKGTLGIGNGSLFFASESDKVRLQTCKTMPSLMFFQTPVQKWSSADISTFHTEKNKHVHIEVGGTNPTSLHFTVSSKDTADAIAAKLSSSKNLTQTHVTPPPAVHQDEEEEDLADADEPEVSPSRSRTPSKAVHFSAAEPAMIPPREPSLTESEAADEYGQESASAPPDGQEHATALYDFDADGEDELSVREGDDLVVLERDSDEWWKCRNEAGAEGVVPASYLEVRSIRISRHSHRTDRKHFAVV